MATSTNNVRKTITNLDEPQQIRELNRQLDWVWRQLLGKLDSKAFSTKGISEILGYTRDVFTEEISNEDVGAAAFLDALGTFAINRVAAHTFTIDEIILMLADALTIVKELSGGISISDLIVHSQNLDNTINTTINNAVSTASRAATDAASAVSTANQAAVNASQASSDASSAVTTANQVSNQLSNLTISDSMIDQSVWDEVQRMIDASISGGI